MVHEIALTIKPTMACNMRCKHCFNGTFMKDTRLVDLASVLRFLDIAAVEFQDIKVTFHGGEPTLAGYDFYREVFRHEEKLFKAYGVGFTNLFTTNGLLLSDRLLELLMKHNTLINISFDGPCNSELREHTAQVLRGIKRVQNKGARLRIYCTVSAPSLPHLRETYEWFKENDLDFKILPIEPRGRAETSRALLMDIECFLDQLEQLYKIWLTDRSCNIRFYTFQEFAKLRRNVQFKPYWFHREIALNPDGLIYPFGRPNDVNFCLGSPFDVEKISECFRSDVYERLRSNIRACTERQCGTCGSFHICRGVCICMAYVYGDDPNSLEYECQMSDGIFRRILAVNDRVVEDFRLGKSRPYNDFVKHAFRNFAPEGHEV